MKSASAASRGINEHVAQGPSAWAQRMLENQGWKKGKGLGKKEDGMVTHVKVEKKEDNAALGFKAAEAAKGNDQWFFGDPFAAARVGGKAAVRLQVERDSEDSSAAEEEAAAAPKGAKRPRPAAEAGAGDGTVELSAAAFPGAPQGLDVQEFYQKLFKATGGARLGMRARRDQPGKWDRAEAKKKGREVLASAAGEAGAEQAAAAAGEAGEAGADAEQAAVDKAARKAARRALREEERLREERAARKARKKERRGRGED